MSDENSLPNLANSLMVAIENETLGGRNGLTRILVDAYYENKLTDLVNLTVRGYNVTPLMHAIRCKVDIDIIRKLINAGADLNDENENDKTPLGELLSNIKPTSSTGKPRDIQYTAEVFIILLNRGVDVKQKSDDKTPLELARLYLTDGDVLRRGKYSKQGIIDMIEQRIELEPSLMELTDKMDNVDDEPLETLIENMKEELSKPRPESRDGKKYLQLLDARQNYTGLTPLFFMLKYSFPPENLLTYYNLFFEYYHPETNDSGEENILDQTYETQTPIMIFFIRFNSKTIHAYNNPVDFLRKMCEDLKVGRNSLTGELRIGHPSRVDEINKRDMWGLTALDYAHGADVEEYINIIKEIHPNAKTGTELGNIDNPASPFDGRPTKVGMLHELFNRVEDEPSTPPHLEDFRLSPPALPATPASAASPATPATPDSVPTPESPPPIRGIGGEDPPPRMGNIDLEVSSEDEEESQRDIFRQGLSDIRSERIQLPEDPTELENLFFAEANKLISATLTNEEAEFIIKKLDLILDKNSELINKYIGESGLTLLMFSTKINPSLHQVIENLMATCNVYGADVLIKSRTNKTILELAIYERNWVVVEILLNYYPLKDLIEEDKDALTIYNLINSDYERYSEELKKGLPDSVRNRLQNDLWMVKVLLKAVFGDLFNIVIDSSSEDNYKWLPENLNRTVIDMNVGIEDLPKDKNYIETVCMGVTHETDEAIKNNAKILEYLLKNGVRAYNSDPDHEFMSDTPLALVLYDRIDPSLPSAEMVRLLLDYGAQIWLQYETVTESGEYSEEFLWDVIEKLKDVMDLPPSGLSAEEKVNYQEEYKKIIALLYQGIALQVILLTPKTIVYGIVDDRFESKMLFQEEREKMLNNLIKFHPEAFTQYPKPTEEFETKEINPRDEVFDVIMQDHEEIGEFLEEDRENHIVMRDYDNPDSTFLIDLTNFRNAIEVDYTPLNHGEIDEDNVPPDLIENPEYNDQIPSDPFTNPTHIEQTYDPGNPNHVPTAGKKGGRGIMFKCNKFLEHGLVTVGSVNNLVPYFDLKGVAGWGGLIPILEVYDKLLNKPVAERGQYFTYKVLDEQINPLSGIGLIQWIGVSFSGRNRFGGRLNYVSGAHCQEGQYGNVTTIIPAKKATVSREGKEDESQLTGGKKRRAKTRRNTGKRKTKSKPRRKTIKLKKMKKRRKINKITIRKINFNKN